MGNGAVYVFDINHLSLPTPFYSVLVSISVFMALSTVFHLPQRPKGRPGMSDVSPLSGISGLSFDFTLLSPLLFFCLVLLLFMSYLFSASWSILLNFFQTILPIFFVRG